MLDYKTGDLRDAEVDIIAHIDAPTTNLLGTNAMIPSKGKHKFVVNCCTRLSAKDPIDFTALRHCMEDLCAFCEEKGCTVGVSKLENTDWKKIEAIIKDIFHDSKIIVYVEEK